MFNVVVTWAEQQTSIMFLCCILRDLIYALASALRGVNEPLRSVTGFKFVLLPEMSVEALQEITKIKKPYSFRSQIQK